MGFFKKLGQTVKKATKQISFKNAVKLAGSAVSALPGIGGIAGSAILSAQDAHYAKKAQAQADNEYAAQVAAENLANAQTKLNDNVNSIGQSIGSQVAQNAYNGLNDGIKTGANNVGANVIQGSLKEWFKKRWYIVVGALLALFLVIKMGTRKSTSYRRR
jgi:hypothetical protein